MITLRQNTSNMKVFKYIYKHFAIILLLLFFLKPYSFAQIPIPKYEARAVWLTTIGGLDWPHSYARTEHSADIQKKEFCDILDKLKAANINTVLLQTRIRSFIHLYMNRGTVVCQAYPAFHPVTTLWNLL